MSQADRQDGGDALTLDQPVTYHIRVPGEIDDIWAGSLSLTVERVDYGPPVSTLVGTFDQAGLHGVLRRLYSLGLPLVSVVRVRGAPEPSS
jgi:hypothetical protein